MRNFETILILLCDCKTKELKENLENKHLLSFLDPNDPKMCPYTTILQI